MKKNEYNILDRTINSLYEVENFLCNSLNISDALCISKILCKRIKRNKKRH